ncbi:MAG: hypothetical protein MUE60_11725, partial [Candidatus Eisenbacteria bacterium]|nr:hypothetical protein [Candidatus Eisenbacteria bacterium]
MRPFPVGVWGGVALCGLLLQGSCVRFNTYYNARRAYRDAEQLAEARVSGSTPGTQELAHLDRCLEKCALIIARHPESGLADDALFLMAMALTLKGQHGAAADKFAELRRFFPESDLDSPSRFHEAESRSQIGQYDAAEALISEHLARGDGWDQWQERGALLYAEVAGRLHVPLVALARIDTLLSRTDRKTVTCPAYLLRARSLAELGRDEEAVRWFREADRTAPS